MQRIMIIGSGGSGKTTLARQLGEKTGLPVVHLDQIWWSPGNWKHLEREEFDALLQKELEKPRWILDGNYNRTMEPRLERCDTVIYLDFPRLVSFTGWLRRVIKNRGRARPDMLCHAVNCIHSVQVNALPISVSHPSTINPEGKNGFSEGQCKFTHNFRIVYT